MSKIVITAGLVSIEDGIKAKEEYAPARKVRVELHFDVPEDQDGKALLDAVAVMAQAKVSELLGSTKVPASSTAGATAAPATTAPGKTLSDKDAAAKAAGLPTTDLVVDPAQVAADKAAALKAPRGAAKTAADKKAAAAAAAKAKEPDPDDLTSVGADEAPAGEPAVSEDDALFTVEAEEITDAMLNHIVQTKNGELEGKGGVAIKKIISSYNPDPTKAFTLKEIPQAARVGFKEKINALTKKDMAP